MNKNLFSIGELSQLQGISRQTLIYYDRIGLFKPSYTDQNTGYRYYDANQLDYLDTICIMKQIGFSLNEIKEQLHNFTLQHSIDALKQQRTKIDEKIKSLQLIKSRVHQRIELLESAIDHDALKQITIQMVEPQSLLVQPVESPYSLEKISLATKRLFNIAFQHQFPIYYQSGVVVPYNKIVNKAYTQASMVFLPIENSFDHKDIIHTPQGRCVIGYHLGDYQSIGMTYEKILDYCHDHGLTITSDSYEFCINDYLSSSDEAEFITKIMFTIE